MSVSPEMNLPGTGSIQMHLAVKNACPQRRRNPPDGHLPADAVALRPDDPSWARSGGGEREGR
ncbi:MAG TPA: hypothetical protein PLY91_02240 [Methanoregulaceae archaeon]|nr:hypothetical protein [Methanoregulaceae archaeon]